jgi:hypothetical protein
MSHHAQRNFLFVCLLLETSRESCIFKFFHDPTVIEPEALYTYFTVRETHPMKPTGLIAHSLSSWKKNRTSLLLLQYFNIRIYMYI